MTLDCLEHTFNTHCIKIEFSQIANFINTTSDDKDFSRFVTNKWIEAYDQSEKNYNPNKEIRIKMSMLRSDICDFSDAFIWKETLLLIKKHLLLMILMRQMIQQLIQPLLILQIIMRLVKKSWFLKTMLHFSTAFKKLMGYKLTTQKI